jgi:hypothetical protein
MATITVTTIADSGKGSLRAAIANADAGDVIKFAATLANKTITLTNKGLGIDKNLTIDGSNAPGLTISGSKAVRIFNVKTVGTKFTVKNLTLVKGFIKNDLGGAIHTEERVQLTVENCQFKNNISRGGGAIFVRDRSTLKVINSKFINNNGAQYGDLQISGGAIGTLRKCNITIQGSQFTNNRGINGGAIYTVFSNLTVESSTFLENDSTAGDDLTANMPKGWGGAIYADGASIPNDPRFYSNAANGDKVGGKIIITDSRIEGNTAAGAGGGLYLFGYPQDQVIVEGSTIINNTVLKSRKGESRGGGLLLGPTQLTVRNTTFAKNIAFDQGGGLWYDGESPVRLINTTFSGNKANGANHTGEGGAIYDGQWKSQTFIINSTFFNNYASNQAGAIYRFKRPITVTNSIFDSNNADGNRKYRQTNSQLTDGGGNIQFPKLRSGEIKVTANIRLVDPDLGLLKDNGGGVLTHALLSGSPAINKGVSKNAPGVDERGFKRDSRIDVGAFEVGATAIANSTQLSTRTLRLATNSDRLSGGIKDSPLIGNFDNDSLLTAASTPIGNTTHSETIQVPSFVAIPIGAFAEPTRIIVLAIDSSLQNNHHPLDTSFQLDTPYTNSI